LRRIHQSGSVEVPRPGIGLPAPGRLSKSPRRMACSIETSTIAARSASLQMRDRRRVVVRGAPRPARSPLCAGDTASRLPGCRPSRSPPRVPFQANGDA
jgi:hypothetical protein